VELRVERVFHPAADRMQGSLHRGCYPHARGGGKLTRRELMAVKFIFKNRVRELARVVGE
jgi:hypothetical protein